MYACQDNAWMDERVMLQWVEQILKPYLLTSPDDVIPLLLLDSYRCHMMVSVVVKIEELGCEIVHIPGGCTGLTQPVDVGVNKPFKCALRTEWEKWMLIEGIQNGTTTPPTRRHIAQWSVTALSSLSTKIVKNAWRHGEYSWFPNHNNNA